MNSARRHHKRRTNFRQPRSPATRAFMNLGNAALAAGKAFQGWVSDKYFKWFQKNRKRQYELDRYAGIHKKWHPKP